MSGVTDKGIPDKGSYDINELENYVNPHEISKDEKSRRIKTITSKIVSDISFIAKRVGHVLERIFLHGELNVIENYLNNKTIAKILVNEANEIKANPKQLEIILKIDRLITSLRPIIEQEKDALAYNSPKYQQALTLHADLDTASNKVKTALKGTQTKSSEIPRKGVSGKVEESSDEPLVFVDRQTALKRLQEVRKLVVLEASKNARVFAMDVDISMISENLDADDFKVRFERVKKDLISLLGNEHASTQQLKNMYCL